MTARCAVTGVACSTAYRYRRCRCDACRGWKREYGRSRRRADPEKEREYDRRWRAANLEKARERDRDYHRRVRAAVVAFLGGVCERCGSTERLDAHHVNGDGREHRKRAGGWRSSYMEILSGTYPREAVVLLCEPCHGCADAEETGE